MILVFKIFLISIVIFSGYKVFFQFHFQILQRGFFLGAAGLIVFFILFPSATIPLAHFFGIGRGVDFIFYLCHVFLFYGLIRLYATCITMQNQITHLVRDMALLKADLQEKSKP